eukprot:Tbor_TRINITY_DN3883_c0_g1::TRINITY_DN3883_c0_g1_i1::g.5638::m.5638
MTSLNDIINNPQGAVLRRMCQQGNVEMALQILNGGAYPNDAQEDGCTALWLAAEAGNLSIIQLLMKYKVNISATKEPGHITPLYIACQNGHVGVVDLLLMNGASPNIAKQNGSTPLHIAAQQGHIDICRLLIRYGAQHSPRNIQGVIPLHLAAYQGHDKVVKLLLLAGVDPHSQSQGKFTLDWASSNGHGPAIQRVIEEFTGDNMTCIAGGTQNAYTAIQGSPEGKDNNKAEELFYTQMGEYYDDNSPHSDDIYNTDRSGWYNLHFLNQSMKSPLRSRSNVLSPSSSDSPRRLATKESSRNNNSGFHGTHQSITNALNIEEKRNEKFRALINKSRSEGTQERSYNGDQYTIDSIEKAYNIHGSWEHFKRGLKNQSRQLNYSRGSVSDGWMYSGTAAAKYKTELISAKEALISSAVERKSNLSANSVRNTKSNLSANSVRNTK